MYTIANSVDRRRPKTKHPTAMPATAPAKKQKTNNDNDRLEFRQLEQSTSDELQNKCL